VALDLVKPSIAWGTITDIKTTEVPLLPRAQGHPLISLVPETSLNLMIITDC
jgi:hypothetical protein